MPKVNREKKYQGHSNEDIKSYNKKIFELRKEIQVLEEKIVEIRNNCDHQFLFWSSGMYEDSYYCELCGEKKDI